MHPFNIAAHRSPSSTFYIYKNTSQIMYNKKNSPISRVIISYGFEYLINIRQMSVYYFHSQSGFYIRTKMVCYTKLYLTFAYLLMYFYFLPIDLYLYMLILKKCYNLPKLLNICSTKYYWASDGFVRLNNYFCYQCVEYYR